MDDGLAIGGAASAIGIDFPYPNFTGPATAMGRLIVAAVSAVRREEGISPKTPSAVTISSRCSKLITGKMSNS